jgi:hypothetical protein
MPDSTDLPEWYFRKAAHRARLKMLEYERAAQAAAEFAEAVKAAAAMREKGERLH